MKINLVTEPGVDPFPDCLKDVKVGDLFESHLKGSVFLVIREATTEYDGRVVFGQGSKIPLVELSCGTITIWTTDIPTKIRKLQGKLVVSLLA
jgi:hypothetical protein